MPPPILAHFGHWYISLPVFMAPMLMLAGGLTIAAWRDRRRFEDDRDEPALREAPPTS